MKKRKRLIIIISSVLAVAIILTLILTTVFGKRSSSSSTSYSSTKVTKGNIEVTVEGSGTVQSSGTQYTYAKSDGTVSAVYKNAGETVNAGDVIAVLTNDALINETNNLLSSLTSIDLEITSSSQATESDGYIYAPVNARVKKIYATANSSVPVVMAKYSALALLSTDGNMVLNITLGDTKVSVGDKVTLTIGSTTKSATVIEATSSTAKILVAGDTYSMDTTVTAKNSSGTVLGTGKLVPNKPITIAATTGTITSVYCSANTSVTKGTKLFAISGALSSSTESLIAKREQAQASYETSKEKVDALTIKATSSGTLVSQPLSVGDTVKSGDELCAIKTSSAMTIQINVDEDDINSIKIGQTAKITFDAIDDKTYTGTVKSVSLVGTTSNQVTTYPVTISIDDADGVTAGMSASAKIVTESKTDVLLVPVGAIMGSGDNKYVLTSLSGSTTNTNSSASATSTPSLSSSTSSGTTKVTVGLVNSSYAEITSGLNEGDTIYYRNASSSSSSSTMMNMQGLTGGGNMGAGGNSSGGSMGDSNSSGQSAPQQKSN